MTSTEYFAGFFDGEGSVNIDRAGYTAVREGRSPRLRHQLTVTVVQTAHRRGVLDLFAARYAGSVTVRALRTSSRPVAQWRAHGRVAARFLEDVLPYLIVKRTEALIGLELVARMGHGFRVLSDTEYAARDDLRDRLHLARSA